MTTPQTTSAPSSLDAVLGKIDALLAAPVAGTATMTASQFDEHVAAELEKCLADAGGEKAEVSKLRLAHLKEQVTAAKASFDAGATKAAVVLFQDPWQTKPGEGAAKTAEVPQPAISPTGSSNVEFKDDVLFVTTEKGRAPSPLLKALCVISKASAESPAHKALLAKTGGAEIIAKAGEARAILASIAMMFGVALEDPEEVLDYEFKWDIADTISALQSAAKLEGVMAQMSGMMHVAAPVAAAAKSASPAPAAAPPPAPPVVAPLNDEAWPLDMARGAVAADAEPALTDLFWGRDSGPAPTT